MVFASNSSPQKTNGLSGIRQNLLKNQDDLHDNFPILSFSYQVMRRLSFVTIVFAVASMFFLGCRQTAGPTAGGAMSSGSMSGAMQSPSFNPFGGATRVSPPPPNAAAVPNPYIGGPPGQTNAVQGTTGGFVSAAPGFGTPPLAPGTSGQVVGSGIHPTMQAGFATTNGTPGPTGGGIATTSYATTAPDKVNPFRAGGMQVNDLTRAPTPPGYRAPVPNNPVPHNAASIQPAFSMAAPPITPANGGFAVGSAPTSHAAPIQQTQYQQPQVWQGSPATFVPAAEVASRIVPVNPTPPNSVPSSPIAPADQPAASPTQSGGTAGSSELMWRRPGS